MADFDQALSEVFKQEGGLLVSEDEVSNFGVRQNLLDAISKRDGTPRVDVTKITPQYAAGIYKKEFWDHYKLDSIDNPRIATLVFDDLVNSNNSAIGRLQNIVGAKVDRKLGPKTNEAINAYIKKHGQSSLVNEFLDRRIERMRKLKNYAKNKNGWEKRVASQRPRIEEGALGV